MFFVLFLLAAAFCSPFYTFFPRINRFLSFIYILSITLPFFLHLYSHRFSPFRNFQSKIYASAGGPESDI